MTRLCAGTPKITVRDNRGLDVRTLRYNRSVDGAVSEQYVDAQTHNMLGQPASSQDPRFFGGATLNFQYAPALSGQVLKTVSVDAGTAKACTDIAGRPIWQHSQGRAADAQSDNNITVQWCYDALGRPVQRNRVMSDVSSTGPIDDAAVSTAIPASDTSDIWCYGEYSGPPGVTYDPASTTDPRNGNRRGQLFQHFDTAGLIDMSAQGYAVQGKVLRQDRHFLAAPCDSLSHWQPGALQALYGLNKQWLESDTDPANLYSTRWAYNALAQVLTQVDAKGHQQHTAYDGAGRKYAASVTPKGSTLRPVCAGITYTAAGEIDTRSDANNIQVAYIYEPQASRRLIGITTSRASATLQALTYAYDGVGNVTSLSGNGDSAQVSFFRNRAVTPDRAYTYDALYQLTSATGRESYVNNTPKGTDWPGAQFNPASTPDYQTYTRSYTYDPGGNLTTINSSNWSGATPPKRELVVGSDSNRAVCTTNSAGVTQANIDTYFDLAGKSICLDANRNRPMYWTALHQLYCVVTTYRPPPAGAGTDTDTGTGTGDWSNCDREQYAYDGSGQRVRKYASNLANNAWNTLDTRYLPGLELRGNTATGEHLEVIVLDDGARVLNWAGGAGKPGDIPNLQLRYQYSDRQNSCQIETDSDGNMITQEEYYPYGGTAVLASRSASEVKYKYIRYSGKERDATGLYYYGLRYYQPWIGRWINPDPARTVDGQNLYCMVGNNPVTLRDLNGLMADSPNPEHVLPSAAPLPLTEPRAANPGESRPPEQVLHFEANDLIEVTEKDGEPVITLDVSQRTGKPPPLCHPRDQQSRNEESVYRADRNLSLDGRLQERIQTLGFTEIRTLNDIVVTKPRGGVGTSAVSYSLGPVISSTGIRRLSYDTWKYIVVPLIRNNRKNPAHGYQNVARQAIENPGPTAALAQKVTLQLVVTRIMEDTGIARGFKKKASGRPWESAKKIVTDELIKSVRKRNFIQGQVNLFGFLDSEEARKKLIDDLRERFGTASTTPSSSTNPAGSSGQEADCAGNSAPSAPGAAPAPMSMPAVSRKREAGPFGDSAPSKASRAAEVTTQQDASAPGPSSAFARPLPPADFLLSSGDFLPPTPMLLQGLFRPELLESIHSNQADPTHPLAHGSGGLYPPGPCPTGPYPASPWPQAVPAQQSLPFSPAPHDEVFAQEQTLENLLSDEYDPTLFLDWTAISQFFSQQPPGQ